MHGTEEIISNNPTQSSNKNVKGSAKQNGRGGMTASVIAAAATANAASATLGGHDTRRVAPTSGAGGRSAGGGGSGRPAGGVATIGNAAPGGTAVSNGRSGGNGGTAGVGQSRQTFEEYRLDARENNFR